MQTAFVIPQLRPICSCPICNWWALSPELVDDSTIKLNTYCNDCLRLLTDYAKHRFQTKPPLIASKHKFVLAAIPE